MVGLSTVLVPMLDVFKSDQEPRNTKPLRAIFPAEKKIISVIKSRNQLPYCRVPLGKQYKSVGHDKSREESGAFDSNVSRNPAHRTEVYMPNSFRNMAPGALSWGNVLKNIRKTVVLAAIFAL